MSQVKLQSSDSQLFTVSHSVAERSMLLKNMLEDVAESEETIPLPNVTGRILKKVLEYCEHHKGDVASEVEADVSESFSSPALKRFDDIEEWDAAFLKVENEELFEIILAANYLDIKPLLDLGCRAVAGMIKGKTPDMIRDMFNIENDLTPEEEDQIRRENEWALDA